MTIRVFVNEIFRGDFADRSEPLRAPRRHINKIAGGDRIPGVAQAVNAAAFEHQEAMLHNVHFNHAERGSRLVDHGVHGEVELHGIGKEAKSPRNISFTKTRIVIRCLQHRNRAPRDEHRNR